ncbi:BREX-1 system protein BrxB [Bacillus toyonensis]|uniref:BREX-1 system protein BrxB n=1 Tax=Bacillus toyonensis TaxID=155322 RepID=UPI0036CEF767
MRRINERLDKILPKITDASFRENKGLGNEIGFYIFDYDPKYEILVREHIVYMQERLKDDSSLHIREFDLYEVMIEILEGKGYLQKNIDMEQKKGSDFILNATRKALRLTSNNDLVVQYITDRVQPNDIVFLTGVGKVFPIIRSHTILNNLHKAIDKVPLVMFFPGTYDGLELKLFGEIKDDNYYRAFQLIDK